MVCDMCGKEGIRQRYVSRSYGKGESLFVIEEVPVMSCAQCGASYLTARTLHAIERLKRLRPSAAMKRPVPVAVFSDVVEESRPRNAPDTASGTPTADSSRSQSGA